MVVLLFVALCACVPFAIERAVRQGGAGRLTVHLTLALATHWLVLATVFTGYLIRPPVTEGRVLRFAVLHVVAAPLLATLTLVAWLLVARRYRVTDASA